ncbi:MAG: helix-turn-helix domain-containing protein [Prolixibacteraceae bacterium]|nr:helix-turn-helix domain-containing protein [Prolixibacteraceae bacterium]
MNTINNVRKYNDGFKTQNNIGPYVQIGHIVYKTSLSLSTKLIYAYLKSFMDNKSGKAKVSYETLAKFSGYSDRKLRNSITTLENDGIITIKKRSLKLRNGVYSTFNEYSFMEDDRYERVTKGFLENKIMDNKDKEFVLGLILHLLPNDCIGSLERPAYHSLIKKWLEDQSGSPMSESTLKRRLKSLKSKKLIIDHDSRYFERNDYVWTGYKFNMFKIMNITYNGLPKYKNDLIFEGYGY